MSSEEHTTLGGDDNLSPGCCACPIGSGKDMEIHGNAECLTANVPRHPGHSAFCSLIPRGDRALGERRAGPTSAGPDASGQVPSPCSGTPARPCVHLVYDS